MSNTCLPQMTLWNFDNDLEKDIIWKRYNFANMLPGDVRAQPEREWHDRKGNELQVRHNFLDSQESQ